MKINSRRPSPSTAGKAVRKERFDSAVQVAAGLAVEESAPEVSAVASVDGTGQDQFTHLLKKRRLTPSRDRLQAQKKEQDYQPERRGKLIDILV